MNNLSSADLQRIRDNAVDAKAVGKYDSTAPWMRFLRDVNPNFVIAVLGELLALREAGKETVAWAVGNDFWNDGSHRQRINGKTCDVFFPGDSYRGQELKPDNYDYAFPLYAAPQLPEGWVMVPIEPTEDMIIYGFESDPEMGFGGDFDAQEAYEAMSGCQQAAHRAKLCWGAMIAAVPEPGTE